MIMSPFHAPASTSEGCQNAVPTRSHERHPLCIEYPERPKDWPYDRSSRAWTATWGRQSAQAPPEHRRANRVCSRLEDGVTDQWQNNFPIPFRIRSAGKSNTRRLFSTAPVAAQAPHKRCLTVQ